MKLNEATSTAQISLGILNQLTDLQKELQKKGNKKGTAQVSKLASTFRKIYMSDLREAVNEAVNVAKTPTKKLVKIYKQLADERLSASAALTFRLIAKELIKRKAKLEGTCGYGIDGKIGDKPAGPHLLKKKKKNESVNEAAIGKVGIGFFIDQLTNAMDHYDERGFVSHLNKELEIDSKVLKRVWKNYLKVSEKARKKWLPRNWERWLKKQGIVESVNEKVIKVSKKDNIPGNPMKMKGEEKIKKLVYSGSVNNKGSYEIKGNKLNVNNIRPRDKGFFVRHFTMGTGFRKANLYYDGVHWQGKKEF